MKITYLHDNGFVVDLDKCILVFDDITHIPPHLLSRGKKIYYFAASAAPDHFSQLIFGCGAVCNEYNTWFVLSSDIPKKGQSNISYMKPYQTLTLEEGVTVKTFSATGGGVAYLVKAEGKTFFHAGSLNWWDWADDDKERGKINTAFEETSFKEEVAKIKAEGPIDFAFYPIAECLGNAAYRGALWFMDEVKPTYLAPMAFLDSYDGAETLATKAFGKATKVLPITKRNETIFKA